MFLARAGRSWALAAVPGASYSMRPISWTCDDDGSNKARIGARATDRPSSTALASSPSSPSCWRTRHIRAAGGTHCAGRARAAQSGSQPYHAARPSLTRLRPAPEH